MYRLCICLWWIPMPIWCRANMDTPWWYKLDQCWRGFTNKLSKQQMQLRLTMPQWGGGLWWRLGVWRFPSVWFRQLRKRNIWHGLLHKCMYKWLRLLEPRMLQRSLPSGFLQYRLVKLQSGGAMHCWCGWLWWWCRMWRFPHLWHKQLWKWTSWFGLLRPRSCKI